MKRSGCVKMISVCLSAVMVIAGMPFVKSNAENAPKFSIQTKSFSPDQLPTDHVEIDVSIANNTFGLLAGSFGICYDSALVYAGSEECTGKSQIIRLSRDNNGLISSSANENAKEAFDMVVNEEKHILWFVSAGSSSQRSNITEEVMFRLDFQLSDEAKDGGSFPIQFVWEGMDGSSAYWYADKQTNFIEEIKGTAQNGAVNIHGGSTLNYTELHMNQETQKQLMLYNVAGTPKWLSTNTKVATVTQDGLVTAVGAGECDIRVNIDRTFKNCHIIVNESDIYSILDETPLILKNPKRDVILEYPDAEGVVLWGSFDPSIIDVDETGKLLFQQGVSCMATIYSEYNGDAPMRDIYIEYTEEPTESFTEEPTEDTTEEPTESSTEEPTEDTTEEPTEDTTEEPTEDTTESTPVPIFLGDVDGNGELDIIDVISVNKAVLGKEIFTPEQNLSADFNQDGKVTASDSLEMLKKIVGLI